MNPISSLFRAYLKCPTKCFLQARGELEAPHTYAYWTRTQQETYAREAIKHLKMEYAHDEFLNNPIGADGLKVPNWRWALEFIADTRKGSVYIPALERFASREPGLPTEVIPVHFLFTNKPTRHDKMLLKFDALMLSEILGCEVRQGKIIYGDEYRELTVKTLATMNEIKRLAEKMTSLLASASPPDLILNRHCHECQFRDRCRQKAIEADDLSLLAAMSEKERSRLRSKGIFTVTQLSYTFRPRKAPKRSKNPSNPHYSALQALAIRNNTVHIHGSVKLHDSQTRVYLDIEGLPDNEFYYLIGALVVADEQETFYSFWADKKSDESNIFAQFAETISVLTDFRVFHFGDYESAALKRIKKGLSDCVKTKIEAILQKATNVLTIVRAHIYFPTYSNSLKDIGRFLGMQRIDENATGLQAIVWRRNWETKHAANLKEKLVQYNKDDCLTLKSVHRFVTCVASPNLPGTAEPQNSISVMRTSEIPRRRSHWELFSPQQYVLQDFKDLIKCAYFDYQREKILVRTNRRFRTVNKGHRKFRHTNIRPNKVINLECKRCPECNSRNLQTIKQLGRLLIDLRYSKGGMKKFVIQFLSRRYKCQRCRCSFNSHDQSPNPHGYGHGLMSWCLYLNVVCGMNMSRVRKSLGDGFGIFLPACQMYRFKLDATALYDSLYEDILIRILQESVLHVDETVVNVRGQSGYVWVFTTIDKVYYSYRSSREGSFLKEMLAPFKGVLISDFYSAYDALPCKQQKCIVHLLRDINDDLMRNPTDTELKSIAQEFGRLLRTIIQTVDNYGLKSRHLRKHHRAVNRFIDLVCSQDYSSELAVGYKRRFEKSGAKMFTFLDHDGVPWNNCNAEHAIKRFAKYRRDANGRFTERSLREYLVLASVFETCDLSNINVLKFLLSKETTLDGLYRNISGNREYGSVRSRWSQRWSAS